MNTESHLFPFIGREKELESLNDLLNKKMASIAVIRGRRRIGKSRLIEEFVKGKKSFIFAGLPPEEKTTSQIQRDEFIKQLCAQTDVPEVKVEDWSNAFQLLAKETRTGRVIIVFDEISWMASKDPNFLGKLKNAWEQHFKKNPQLILILCGSVSTWIEKNILSSTGFFGRIALKLTLDELPLVDCNALLTSVGFKRSSHEKLMILAATGSIPWYLELINPKYSANENIKKLCFEKDGILVDEFHYIFHDLFRRRAEIYKKIVEALSNGPAEYTEIVKKLGYSRSGTISDYLDDLITSGFLRKDRNWSLQTGKASRLHQYRLKDNYLRFYLKYIEPKMGKIELNHYEKISLESMAGWESVLGLQFENLVLNNRKLIQTVLGIKSEEIIFDNPYFQHKTNKQSGCQIDYLIQTKYNNLFVCECKFNIKEIGPSVIEAMKQKISKIVVPKGFAVLPVLIHTGAVSEAVSNADYFYKIINFNDFLNV